MARWTGWIRIGEARTSRPEVTLPGWTLPPRHGLRRLALPGLALPLLASCAWSAAGSTGCLLDRAPVPLPEGVGESSGLAVVGGTGPTGSFSTPAGDPSGDETPVLLWTHNDSGSEPFLVAVDLSGHALDSVRLSPPPSVRIRDLEALEAAICEEGRCLYAADVGDNEERRSDAAVHRLPEPELSPEGDGPGEGVVETTVLPVRFPDGPTDVEALFVLPGEEIHLVSKGRSGPVTVYRYPPPLRPGRRVTLERVQTLGDGAPLLPAYVTGAAATSDGRTVAIRTYEALEFFRVGDGRLVRMPGMRMGLRTLREAQGEAVSFLPDGRVVLSSEAGPLGRRGGLAVLRCPGVVKG